MAKIDFGMTDDGDLSLGAPKYSDNNELLYIYSDGTISIEKQRGEEFGRMICDMTYTYDNNTFKQIILNRLRTDAPDWFHYPTLGGNLTDLIGEPNTQATGELGQTLIYNALTYGGLFAPSELSVRAVPVNEEEIMFLITVTNSSQSYRLPLILNLNHGLKEV